MHRSRLVFVPTSSRFWRGLLFAFLAVPLGAQELPKSHAGRGFGPAYDTEHETTLIGTIQQVFTQRNAGGLNGMHLLVAGSNGVVDTHIGRFVDEDTKGVLRVGMPVQVIGAIMQLRGEQVLLARELSIGGRTITVRSTRGFPVYSHQDRIVKSNSPSTAEASGGTR